MREAMGGGGVVLPRGPPTLPASFHFFSIPQGLAKIIILVNEFIHYYFLLNNQHWSEASTLSGSVWFGGGVLNVRLNVRALVLETKMRASPSWWRSQTECVTLAARRQHQGAADAQAPTPPPLGGC